MTAWTAVLHAAEADRPARQAAGTQVPAVGAEVLAAQQPYLRRLVHRLLAWPGATAEVDDVVQEALLDAWAARHTFRGDASVRTWLWQIALNRARRHVRWRRLRTRTVRPLEGEVPDTKNDDPADRRERSAAVHRALAALTHRDREVLVLRYLEERSVHEIAELLCLRRAAVDTRLSRARRRLAGLLEPGGDA